MRALEGFASLTVIEDRDLATPPGSPVDGARYLVAASPTGAWTGHAGDIARRMNTAWEFHEVFEGLLAWVKDEDTLIQYDGSAWVTFTAPAVPPVSTTQSGTSYTAVIGDANTYIRFTNSSPVTFTIPANASVAFPIDTVIEFEQAGTGAVTVAPDTGVAINSRAADLELAGLYAVAALKKVATNTWTLTGDL